MTDVTDKQMLIAIYDKIQESFLVAHSHLQPIVSELVSLDKDGFVDDEGNKYFVQVGINHAFFLIFKVVSVVMDDPALRKFLGIAGHGANISCPLCVWPSRQNGEEQSFCWATVSRASMEELHRSNNQYRQG